jgi:hypothetical protein
MSAPAKRSFTLRGTPSVSGVLDTNASPRAELLGPALDSTGFSKQTQSTFCASDRNLSVSLFGVERAPALRGADGQPSLSGGSDALEHRGETRNTRCVNDISLADNNPSDSGPFARRVRCVSRTSASRNHISHVVSPRPKAEVIGVHAPRPITRMKHPHTVWDFSFVQDVGSSVGTNHSVPVKGKTSVLASVACPVSGVSVPRTSPRPTASFEGAVQFLKSVHRGLFSHIYKLVGCRALVQSCYGELRNV